MRVLALDIGEKRIGLASGDTYSRVSSPVVVLSANDVLQNAPAWRTILTDYEPELLVFGLPKSLSGAQGAQAARVRGAAEQIAIRAGLPYEFADERLSSSEAKRYLRKMGQSEKQMRGKIDCIAASLFLQTWLDARASEED